MYKSHPFLLSFHSSAPTSLLLKPSNPSLCFVSSFASCSSLAVLATLHLLSQPEAALPSLPLLKMFFHTTILLLSAAASTLATNHKGIPAAFSKGFDASGTTAIQVKYDTAGDITDGQDLTGQDLTKVPGFALGDSSGINTSAKFIVLMLDPDVNGDPEIVNPQRLHYMRTDFTPGAGLGVQIASEVPPAVKYVGPEATTDAQGTPVHRYVYLLYKQPREFALQGVDSENREGFNVTAWRELNGLEPAVAGLHFMATVGTAMEGGMSVTQDLTQTSQVASTSCTSTGLFFLKTIESRF